MRYTAICFFAFLNMCLFTAVAVAQTPLPQAPTPQAPAALSQDTVFTSFQTALEDLKETSGPDKADWASIDMARQSLMKMKGFTESSGTTMPQGSLSNLLSLTDAIAQVKNKSQSDPRRLRILADVADDLRIKARYCEKHWIEGGLKELHVNVVTKSPDDPHRMVNGCRIGCVVAAWYGDPQQDQKEWYFPGLSSPSSAPITPGLYYWWSQLGGTSTGGSLPAKPALFSKAIRLEVSDDDQSLDVPAPTRSMPKPATPHVPKPAPSKRKGKHIPG